MDAAIAKMLSSKNIAMVESLKIPEVFVGDKVLGVGSFAEVLEGKWRGTVCAVKRLHRITVTELHSIVVDKFMNECQMWSRLRHPNIVLFLGVIQSPEDVLPSLVLEKMSTNLTKFIEDRNRQDLQLNQKSYILQQVSHALLYIHSQSPPLLHRDLTPNNVLLDECSLKAKLTDFGLSRVGSNNSTSSRRSILSAAPGTPAFMPPEAKYRDPVYDMKLDVFSYGNLVAFVITHQWPEPDQPVKLVDGELVAFSEYERRAYFINAMSEIEGSLFNQLVKDCLQNEPHKRPTTEEIVRRMQKICSEQDEVVSSCMRNDKNEDIENVDFETLISKVTQDTLQLSEYKSKCENLQASNKVCIH